MTTMPSVADAAAEPPTARLTERMMREYRAILGLVRDRQCDSLGDFALAEHLRSVLARHDGPRSNAMRAAPSTYRDGPAAIVP